MKTLDDMVKETVKDFVTGSTLFTALDVSNKVKEAMPFARHREIRDIVRNLFTTEIETAGYTKTSISVTLKDNSTADALLYHPLIDSWDLDNKYSAQQRAGGLKQVQAPQSAPAIGALTQIVPLPPVMKPAPMPKIVPVTPVVAPPAPAARVLWDQLFGSQPSLFPRK